MGEEGNVFGYKGKWQWSRKSFKTSQTKTSEGRPHGRAEEKAFLWETFYEVEKQAEAGAEEKSEEHKAENAKQLWITEGGPVLAKRAGAYKSEKRKKELSRQKKQEEKRQRRFKKDADMNHDSEIIDPERVTEEKE